MSIGQAAVLGLVEGLTEFLPVSSTGHLILAQRAMGIGGSTGGAEAANAYAICIQAGAILAVLGLYRDHLAGMARGLVGRNPAGLRLAVNLGLAFLPAAVIGLFFFDAIKERLFGLWPVVWAWMVGGVAILAVARYRRGATAGGRDMLTLTWLGAIGIGLIQCLAVWPGTSRSLVTIVGGVLVGLHLRDAVIFSFLLGALTLGASTAHDAWYHGHLLLESYGAASLLTGFVVAWISAVAAIEWMVAYLKRHGLALFGYYRIGLALVVGALLAGGFLQS
jgi:undecaprenyl-diphosphatase